MGQKAQRILTLIEDGDLVESLDFVLRAVEDAVRIADEQALAAAAREAQAERQEFDRQPTIDSVFDALHELPDELQTIVDASSPDTRFDEDITSVRAKLQSLQTEDEVAEQGPLGLQVNIFPISFSIVTELSTYFKKMYIYVYITLARACSAHRAREGGSRAGWWRDRRRNDHGCDLAALS